MTDASAVRAENDALASTGDRIGSAIADVIELTKSLRELVGNG